MPPPVAEESIVPNNECELQQQNEASKGNGVLLHHGESPQDIGGRGNGAASAASGGPLIEEQQQPVVLMMEGGEAGIIPPRREGLNRAELIELLEEQYEEAQRIVRQSKKSRYLRSFREFLGMGNHEDNVPRNMNHWTDRIGGGYKKWVGSGRAGSSHARTRGYVGAARSMLRAVKRHGWVIEAVGGSMVTRGEVLRAIEKRKAELQQVCDKADEERLQAFCRYLSGGGGGGEGKGGGKEEEEEFHFSSGASSFGMDAEEEEETEKVLEEIKEGGAGKATGRGVGEIASKVSATTISSAAAGQMVLPQLLLLQHERRNGSDGGLVGSVDVATEGGERVVMSSQKDASGGGQYVQRAVVHHQQQQSPLQQPQQHQHQYQQAPSSQQQQQQEEPHQQQQQQPSTSSPKPAVGEGQKRKRLIVERERGLQKRIMMLEQEVDRTTRERDKAQRRAQRLEEELKHLRDRLPPLPPVMISSPSTGDSHLAMSINVVSMQQQQQMFAVGTAEGDSGGKAEVQQNRVAVEGEGREQGSERDEGQDARVEIICPGHKKQKQQQEKHHHVAQREYHDHHHHQEQQEQLHQGIHILEGHKHQLHRQHQSHAEEPEQHHLLHHRHMDNTRFDMSLRRHPNGEEELEEREEDGEEEGVRAIHEDAIVVMGGGRADLDGHVETEDGNMTQQGWADPQDDI